MNAPVQRGTQVEMMKDPKWRGVPPVGNRPVDNRWRFLSFILLAYVVKLVIWGAYRFITGNVYPFTDPVVNYSMGTFMKPLLQLGPLVLIWWFVFKERGLPFRFTKKHLGSSIFFGLLMALVFFFTATFVYMLHNMIMGYGTDFHFVAGWDEVGWALIIATMFSFMIGTGPAEELFSRGFIQDQSARAFPLWQAMVISAILFAAGHIPISVFMYHMPFDEMMWYMAVLVVMGLFFSIIYQWSRNIVFPILIHGLWDWYLTLFAVKGEFSPDIVNNPGAFFGMVDFINTIITIAILLPVFYMIYRRFWKRSPVYTGSPMDTPQERFSLFRWLKEKDQGMKRPVITTVSITFVFCLLMLPLAGVVGVDDPALQKDRVSGGGGEMVELTEQERVLYGAELDQGGSDEYSIKAVNGTLDWVNISLTWEDEPDAGPRYTNQPDTFGVTLMTSEGEELDSMEGHTGAVSIVWIPEEGLVEMNNVTVVVELLKTGDQEPIVSILGLRDIADDKNTYGLDVRYQYTYSAKREPEDLDIRW